MIHSKQLPRAYRRAAARRGQALSVANACFDGLWLGVLGPTGLARVGDRFFGREPGQAPDGTFSFRDDAYNLAGLREWEAAHVYRYVKPNARITVTSAGAGREVIGLCERGYDAVGYEPNRALAETGAALLERTRRPGRLHRCERDAFPAEADTADAVLVGWSSYGLIGGRARRVAFLRGARATLAEGAPLLCSFPLRNPGSRYYRVVAAAANAVRRARRAPAVELGDTLQDTFAHHFTPPELESELADGGFRLVAFKERPYPHAVAVAAGAA